MLERLDRIDWSRLQTSRGHGGAIPGLLRALADEDPAIRAETIQQLAALVHHQESVYSGSTATVPFLIELCASPEVPDRHVLLRLLLGMALGDPGAFLIDTGIRREDYLSTTRTVLERRRGRRSSITSRT